jgi:hypothetical protein
MLYNVLAAIALEGAYQLTITNTNCGWSRERFFEEGERLVRKARIRRGE